MAARRLREPVVQMRETLSFAKAVDDLERRVDLIERLMLARNMEPAIAKRRLSRALNLSDGPDWTFETAWEIAWQTIYWPHRKEERDFEIECLEMAKSEFRLAWHGRQTKLEGLRELLEALEDARASDGTPLTGELVA